MGHSIKLITLISVLLFSSCTNNQQAEHSLFDIEVIKKIELDDQASQYLYSLYPIASASVNDEIIALPNYRNPIGVTLIDYEGNYISHVGSEGRGPEEIQSARYIGLDYNNNVVINDKASALIKKYDSSDGTVHAFRNYTEDGFDLTSRDMKQCDNQWILSINHHEYAPSDTSTMIGILDDEFRFLEMFGSFDPYLLEKKTILQDPILSVDCESRELYTTHVKVPFIQIYDLDDHSKTGRIEQVPESFKLSDRFIDMIEAGEQMDYRRFLIEEQSVSLMLSQNDQFLMLLFRNDTEEFYETRNFIDREHFIAVYSLDDYSYLGEERIDGAPLGATKEGFLINLVNDDPLQLELIDVGQNFSE